MALAVAAGPSSAKDWSKVRIATEGAYAPWNFTDSSGKLIGFELDLAEDLCKRMGVECEIRRPGLGRNHPRTHGGQVRCHHGRHVITDERKKTISFSDAYAATPARFVVLKDSPSAKFTTDVDFITLDDIDDAEKAALEKIREEFKDQKIGVQISTTHANFLDAEMSEVSEVKQYDTPGES